MCIDVFAFDLTVAFEIHHQSFAGYTVSKLLTSDHVDILLVLVN